MNNQESACVITQMRNSGWWMKSIAAIVLISFGGLITSPAVAAVRAEMERQERHALREPSQAEKLNTVLLEVKEQLGILAGKSTAGLIAASQAPATVAERQAAHKRLQALREQLRALDKAAREGFREVRQHIRKHGLSDVILQRHIDAVVKYEAKAAALLESLAALETAKGDAAQKYARKIFKRLSKTKLGESQKPFDPNKLPFAIPDNKVRKPATTPAELLKVTGMEPALEPALLLASTNNAVIPGFAADDPANPAYLAATPDAQITPEIKTLAADLEHNPVKIYNWVRNNIEYMPTYGSIQGSAQTLATGRGNAFDTASLLVALLRASDIPARYVYGTVEIPADKVMNWVGGVTDPMAAGNLMGQGGIPNTALTLNGEVKAFRLEHVWVEAYVDFYPSRGAVNRQGDTWIPMDASFKQYTYTQGMDVVQQVPFDAQGFAQEITENAIVNEEEGWVKGVDQSLIQSRLRQYQADIEAFIKAQGSSTTVGDVLGEKTIIKRDVAILPASLPMKLTAIGDRYSKLPDALRLKFQYTLQDKYGQTLASFQANTVDLAGKRFALSFRPATQADADTIASYLPEPPADGSDIDPADIPDSLPGYLINMTAEFTVNGKVVKTGPTSTMGTEIYAHLGYYFPGQGWKLRPKSIITGEYQAIGLDLAGIASRQLHELKDNWVTVKEKLETRKLSNLTRHSLTGNLLQTGVLVYFARNDINNLVGAKVSGLVAYRLPSFGSFSIDAQPRYWFGLPRNVGFTGYALDIDSLYIQVVDESNAQQDVVNFMHTTGARTSALEHIVPEQLFGSENDKKHGVSAVKAIAIAEMEGQTIYAIGANNLDAALSVINAGSLLKNEIRNSVNAGKRVIVHAQPINYYKWSGFGYIIIDPATGAGAYKLSGGINGGVLQKTLTIVDAVAGVGESWGIFLHKYVKGAVKGIAFLGIFLDILKLWEACGPFAAILLSILNAITAAALSQFVLFLGPLLFSYFFAILFFTIVCFFIISLVMGAVSDAQKKSCEGG